MCDTLGYAPVTHCLQCHGTRRSKCVRGRTWRGKTAAQYKSNASQIHIGYGIGATIGAFVAAVLISNVGIVYSTAAVLPLFLCATMLFACTEYSTALPYQNGFLLSILAAEVSDDGCRAVSFGIDIAGSPFVWGRFQEMVVNDPLWRCQYLYARARGTAHCLSPSRSWSTAYSKVAFSACRQIWRGRGRRCDVTRARAIAAAKGDRTETLRQCPSCISSISL